MAEATVIAVLGARPADSTALAAALASRLAFETGLHCDWLHAPADSALPAQALVRCRTDAAAPAAAGPPDPVALTLLLALDSPHHDAAAEARDTALRLQLQAARAAWVPVRGRGPALLEAALDAVTPLLRQRALPRAGLLTRLARRDAAMPRWTWVCEKCDVPECEHAQLR